MSSMPEKFKFNVGEIESYDNPTMRNMTEEQYRRFVQNGELMYVDHHDVLRSYIADYPLAATREQLDILIEELQKLRGKMVSAKT